MRLNLPEYEFNIKKNGETLVIFDSLRKRFVALTPEEWVRQNFVRYLIDTRHFPQALMANEMSIIQNGIKRRCDTVVADHSGQPLMIVEYKAPSVEVTQKVFDQILRYNMVLRARYLTVTNGLRHYCCRIDYNRESHEFLTDIPYYNEL